MIPIPFRKLPRKLPRRSDKAVAENKFQFGKLRLFFHTKQSAPDRRTGRCAWGSVVFSKGCFNGCRSCCAGRLGLDLTLKISWAVQDLVGPEPLEPVQRLVQRRELFVRDATDLLHRLDVLLIERIDDAADLLALRGQADANRAAINTRALMIEEAELDQLLQIVGHVGAEVVAACAQFARGQFLVTD